MSHNLRRWNGIGSATTKTSRFALPSWIVLLSTPYTSSQRTYRGDERRVGQPAWSKRKAGRRLCRGMAASGERYLPRLRRILRGFCTESSTRRIQPLEYTLDHSAPVANTRLEANLGLGSRKHLSSFLSPHDQTLEHTYTDSLYHVVSNLVVGHSVHCPKDAASPQHRGRRGIHHHGESQL